MSNDIGTYVYDNLLASEVEVTDSVTVISGAGILARGTVLGKITASGKCKIVNSANSDGSQTPYAILLEPVDATSADKVAGAAISGVFNTKALIFGGTDTIATHQAGLRDVGLYVKTNQSAIN